MDIEAILKDYTSMMKRTKTALSLKSFKSETQEEDEATVKKDGQKKTKSAAERRKGLAIVKGHSIYMQPNQAKAAKKQQNLVEEEEKISGKVGLRDYRNFLSYSLGCVGIILYLIICSAATISQLAVSLFIANWAAEPLEEQ